MDKFPFYTGQPLAACSEKPAVLPILERSRQAEARAYIAEQGLVEALLQKQISRI